MIVGAGIGGLAAAASLRRQGHRVQIFESSAMNKEIGAAVIVHSNSLRVLDHLGYNKDNLKGVDNLKIMQFDSEGGEGITRPFTDPQDTFRTGYMVLRTDLHDELKRLAIGSEGEGLPAILHLATEVSACDIAQGTVTLKNGQVHQADLIIGADGIHSVVRTSVLGYVQTAPASGISVFRCLLDASKLSGRPELDWVIRDRDSSGPTVVRSKGELDRFLIFYPCRGGTLINVAGLFPDTRDQDKHGWSAPATREQFLEEFEDFHPNYRSLVELADDPVTLFQLRMVPTLPTWINDRVALLGDAAHATFPALAQGAGMALEDAATIGCLLPYGTTRDQVPSRLEAYQQIRKSRCEFVSIESVEQITVPSKRGLYANSPEMRSAVVGHDAIEVGQSYYREHFGGASVGETSKS